MNLNMEKNPDTACLIDDNIYHRVLQSDLMKIFEEHHNKKINPYYIDRSDRNRFAAIQLQGTPINRILNLGGGGRRHLKESLKKEIEVYEVDIQGDCDLEVNLDTLKVLPFADQSFDVVCAFDVLEHLENFHLINNEMFRIAQDYVLISLPNSACDHFFDVLRNRTQKDPDVDRGVFSKFYGLPIMPPSDRHRWWINFHDVIRFYYYFSLKNNATLEFWTPKLNFKKRFFRSILGSHIYYSFFCPHIWIKLGKQS